MSEADPPRRLLPRFVYWGLVMALWLGLAVGVLVFYYALDLPDTDDLWKTGSQPELSIYARDDGLVARRGRAADGPCGLKISRRIWFKPLSPLKTGAFSHFGLDPRGLARAMAVNLRQGRLAQGGSTLTQQLAKNVFLTPERSFKRKVQELLLAFWLEAHFSKQDILALYLNRVYFGSGAYGVQAAAETYFNRPCKI